jgi:hypothetical protein
MEWVIVHINVQPQIPSRRGNVFGVVTKLLFQLDIRAFLVSATGIGVGVVVVRIVIVAVASVVKFGVPVVSKVVGSARVLLSVILAGGV